MSDHDPTYVPVKHDASTMRYSGVAVHGMTPFDVTLISNIDGNLWQGGVGDDGWNPPLPDFIRNVVSLYRWGDYAHGELDYHKVVTMYDSLNGIESSEEVDRLARLVNELVAKAPTLVHCQAGLNRSSLIAARSLMLRDENPLTADEAITLIRDRRSPACLCNPAFEKWLRDRDGAYRER